MKSITMKSSCALIVASISMASHAQAQAVDPPAAPSAGVAEERNESVVPTAEAPEGNKLGVSDNVGSLDREVEKKTWPNVPLLVTGLVVLGGSYGASAIVGAASDRKEDDKLFIPVVGPWLDLHQRDCSANPCSNEGLNKALLISDGVLQGVGALGIVLSWVIPQTTTRNWYLIGNQSLAVSPQLSNLGLRATGQF
jgi:hypothetical protein